MPVCQNTEIILYIVYSVCMLEYSDYTLYSKHACMSEYIDYTLYSIQCLYVRIQWLYFI